MFVWLKLIGKVTKVPKRIFQFENGWKVRINWELTKELETQWTLVEMVRERIVNRDNFATANRKSESIGQGRRAKFAATFPTWQNNFITKHGNQTYRTSQRE